MIIRLEGSVRETVDVQQVPTVGTIIEVDDHYHEVKELHMEQAGRTGDGLRFFQHVAWVLPVQHN